MVESKRMVESKSEIKFLLEQYEAAMKALKEIEFKLEECGLTVQSA